MFLKAETTGKANKQFAATASTDIFVTVTYTEDTSMSDGVYFVRSVINGKYLDRVTTDNRTNSWGFDGRPNQQWRVTRNSDGTYGMQPMDNQSMYLEVYGVTDADLRPITQTIYSPSNIAAKMRIIKNKDGTYRIMPAISKTRSLDIYYGSDTTMTFNGRAFPKRYGIDVQLYDYGGGNNQKWTFDRVNYDLINQLHQAAKNKDSSVAGSYRKMFNYLRTNFYSGTSWNESAGSLDSSFKSYADSYNFLLPNLHNIRQVVFDPKYGEVDFTHMAATGNALLYSGSIVLGLSLGDEDVDALAGWAGDLQSLIKQAIQNPGVYYGQTFYDRIYNMVGHSLYNFSLADLMADIDAMYFVENASTTNFGTTLKNYYADNGQHKNRRTYFNGRVSESKVLYYAKQNKEGGSGLYNGKWPIYAGLIMGSGSVNVSSTQANDAKNAFRAKLSYYW